jgi:hypothetical protein
MLEQIIVSEMVHESRTTTMSPPTNPQTTEEHKNKKPPLFKPKGYKERDLEARLKSYQRFLDAYESDLAWLAKTFPNIKYKD